jgi:uncharacterized protein YfkK (UPF0435 family)
MGTEKTPILPSHTFASLDISNMYTNIPIAETIHILNKTLERNGIDTNTTQELLSWYDTVTKQNYFSFREHAHPNRRTGNGRPIVQHPLRNFPSTHQAHSHS